MAQYNIRFPRFGTVTLLSMWQKGKKGKNFRFLVEEADGTQRFLWLAGHPVMGKRVEYADYDDCKVISPTHIKNQNYNYYHVSNSCEPEFEQMLVDFEASDPVVAEKLATGPCMHTNYSRVNYKLWEKV